MGTMAFPSVEEYLPELLVSLEWGGKALFSQSFFNCKMCKLFPLAFLLL